MGCTRRQRRRSSFAIGWSVALGIALTAAAQDRPGAVPTDYYGPPVCSSDAKPPVHSDALQRARREQLDGIRDSHAILSNEPLENFGVARYKLVEYGDCTGDSGCYWADLDTQYKRAEAALAVELAQHKGEKLAIVMDIDETTLTNWCEMRREDFGYIPAMDRAWEVSPESSTPIPGALRLFNQAKTAGVAVFFITGRPGTAKPGDARPSADETAATARNLETAGLHGWAGLLLRNGPENQMPTIEYKSSERRRIQAQGYRILLSIGDQWSDLLGDPRANVSVKLPNPFYFIP